MKIWSEVHLNDLNIENTLFLLILFYQAKVETPRLIHFRLGYSGNEEEVKALTLVAIGAAPARVNTPSDGESLFNLFIVFYGFHAFVSLKFCLLFCGKKVKAHARLEGRKGCAKRQIILLKTS